MGPTGAGTNAGSEVLVARAGRMLGTLHVKDTLRPEAIQAVAAVRTMGLRTILLTGDSTRIAEEIAKALAIDEFAGELLPDQKLARVRALREHGSDGVNDAPSTDSAWRWQRSAS